MMDESTTEQVQQGTTPAPGEQVDQLTPVAHQEGELDAADRFFNNSGAAIDIPPAEVPEDDDMKAIRSEWTFYPAEVNKSVPHEVFDSAIGKTIDLDGQQVEVTRSLARKAVGELRAVVGDIGLSKEEVSSIAQTMNRLASSGTNDDPIQNRERAVDLLNREHGENAAQALRAARAYISKNPKLGRLLDQSGLGDDPATVATIARRALALNRSGKLKVK
ncbi:MAG: hypothetical protein Q8L16_26915 [Hydrogenophaga sp.]|nr:hypothetical protein [Hydrogenophaga sp.]